MGNDRGFIIPIGYGSIAGNANTPNGYAQRIAVCGFTTFANGHNHAAPVGIFSRNGGFDQGGIANSHGHTPCGLVGNSTADGNAHQLGCALPITNDQQGQFAQQVVQCSPEIGQSRVHQCVHRIGHGGVACCAGSKQQNHVRCGCIGINGNAVEGLFDPGTKERLQNGRG